MSFGPAPWQQTSWDWRAAANFMAGGAGSGLVVAAFMAGGPRWLFAVGVLLVAAGLLAVWAEIGRPWRALNVFRQARRSWMSREALVAPPLLAAAVAAAFGLPGAAMLAVLLALAFVVCQGRILQAARGIPAWRSRFTAPLIVATALAEGAALWLLLAGRPATLAPWGGLALALVVRLVLWNVWRGSLGAERAAPAAQTTADHAGRVLKAATLVPLAGAVLVALAPLPAGAGLALQVAAGALALAGGLWFKFSLVTRTGFNQGFALPQLPVRGVRRQELRP
ncbi:MAG: dimethyl sulfoxide reductase anchor subunit [Rubrivivax sp.]|nr:dimethyl sulfoxide reductase anchor subunit [Rubrivivax sp.]